MPFYKSEQFLRFKAQFKGLLVLPDDATYKQAVGRWSTLAQREAGAIAYPKDVNDVSLAVQFAVDQDLELAIRGESHPHSMLKGCTFTLGRRRSRPFSGLLH